MARNRFARGIYGLPPVDGGYPKAHPKDPALYYSRPYVPVVQSDLVALRKIDLGNEDNEGLDYAQGHPERVRRGLARGPEWADERAFVNVTPLWQAPRIALISAVNTPVKLFDANARRLSFLIGNSLADTVFFSYGFPIANTGGTFLGIPIGTVLSAFPTGPGYFIGSDGAASIQEIYVWLGTGGTVPTRVIGYEGVLATDANIG